jgi:GH24 family phage-related lysozyme (muramidase)
MKKEINEDLQKWFKQKRTELYTQQVDEGFASKLGTFALSGALGLGAAMTTPASATPPPKQQKTAQKQQPKAAAKTPAPKAQQERPKYADDTIKKMVISDEGIRTKPYKDTKGILTVGVGHNLQAAGSKAAFTKAFGADGEKLHKHASGGGALTDEQARKLFDADYEEHLQRTVKMIPNLHEHPPEVQAALVSGVYRGHVTDSPTFRKQFNAGNYEQASKEFLNRAEYKDSKTPKGVINRLNRDQQIYSNYAASKKKK